MSGPGLAFIVLGAQLLVGTFLVDDASHEPFRGRGSTGRLPARRARRGYVYAFRDQRRRLLVGLVGAGSLVLGTIDTLIVVLALDVLKTGDAGVGFLNAALGVGAVAGATVAMVAGQRARLFPGFRAGLIGAGSPLIATAAAPRSPPPFSL